VWQRPLLADASVALRMRRNKYVALADILPPAIADALQIYYRNIIQNKYKVRFAMCVCVCVCVWVGGCMYVCMYVCIGAVCGEDASVGV
jgi:hypothetical protein